MFSITYSFTRRVLFTLSSLLFLAACVPAPDSAGDPSTALPSRDFKPGDVIITTEAACDQVYTCILAKRPEYQATLDTINLFQGDARVEACNNSLINPLEILPECAPAGTGS